ncbi:MAG: hypothetical protein MdMp024_0177 [Bacteroidales bacterium]
MGDGVWGIIIKVKVWGFIWFFRKCVVYLPHDFDNKDKNMEPLLPYEAFPHTPYPIPHTPFLWGMGNKEKKVSFQKKFAQDKKIWLSLWRESCSCIFIISLIRLSFEWEGKT